MWIDLSTIKAYIIHKKMSSEEIHNALSNGEDWKIVAKKRKKAQIPHQISPVFCAYESELWNLYFETLTGKNIGFEITPHSFPYFSPLECRRNLDVLLQTLFSKRPIVLDLTCGSGSDSIAFLMHLDPEQIFCVDCDRSIDFWPELWYICQEQSGGCTAVRHRLRPWTGVLFIEYDR